MAKIFLVVNRCLSIPVCPSELCRHFPARDHTFWRRNQYSMYCYYRCNESLLCSNRGEWKSLLCPFYHPLIVRSCVLNIVVVYIYFFYCLYIICLYRILFCSSLSVWSLPPFPCTWSGRHVCTWNRHPRPTTGAIYVTTASWTYLRPVSAPTNVRCRKVVTVCRGAGLSASATTIHLVITTTSPRILWT